MAYCFFCSLEETYWCHLSAGVDYPVWLVEQPNDRGEHSVQPEKNILQILQAENVTELHRLSLLAHRLGYL